MLDIFYSLAFDLLNQPCFKYLYLLYFIRLMIFKRISNFRFSMLVSLFQWHGEIGAFYSKSQIFFNSYSVGAPSYTSIWHNFSFTKLLNFAKLHFNLGFCFLIIKKINDIVFMIKPYIRSVTYFLITWSLLNYIWYYSWIIIFSGNIKTNPGPKNSFSRR